jgi:hypothetical protein
MYMHRGITCTCTIKKATSVTRHTGSPGFRTPPLETAVAQSNDPAMYDNSSSSSNTIDMWLSTKQRTEHEIIHEIIV